MDLTWRATTLGAINGPPRRRSIQTSHQRVQVASQTRTHIVESQTSMASAVAVVLGSRIGRAAFRGTSHHRRRWFSSFFLGAGVSSVTAAEAPAEAKGNPFVLLQDGMEAFRNYKVEDSVRLFDEAAESGYPKARLWQRGLSLYYAERFDDGTQQFRKDVEMNPNDTEESLWAFLCEAQTVGFDKARQQLMKVGFDPRPVMSSVYALYRGDDDAKFIDILEGLYKKGGSDAFYASLYLGLYYEAKMDKENAKLWLLRSVDSNYGKSSNDYMTDLARVHVARRQWRNTEL